MLVTACRRCLLTDNNLRLTLYVSTPTLLRTAGDVYGQAARIDSIVDSSGASVNLAAPPTAPQEEVDAQTASVDEQGEMVRRLKEDEGLSNEDPQVRLLACCVNQSMCILCTLRWREVGLVLATGSKADVCPYHGSDA